MGEIGRKFRQHMLVCGYLEATRESYEQAVVALVRDYGVALPVIQRLLGHSSLSTTAVYCHVSRALMANVRSPGDTLALDGPRNRPAVEV